MPKVQRTVHGITLNLDPRIFTDLTFVDAMTLLMQNNEELDEEAQAQQGAEAMTAVREMAKLVFGDRLKAIQNRLREENEGFLDYETWIQFLVDVMQAYQKNDNARSTVEWA